MFLEHFGTGHNKMFRKHNSTILQIFTLFLGNVFFYHVHEKKTIDNRNKTGKRADCRRATSKVHGLHKRRGVGRKKGGALCA